MIVWFAYIRRSLSCVSVSRRDAAADVEMKCVLLFVIPCVYHGHPLSHLWILFLHEACLNSSLNASTSGVPISMINKGLVKNKCLLMNLCS